MSKEKFNREYLANIAYKARPNILIIKKWEAAIAWITFAMEQEAKNSYTSLEVDLKSIFLFLRAKDKPMDLFFSIGEYNFFIKYIIEKFESKDCDFKISLVGDILTINWE